MMLSFLDAPPLALVEQELIVRVRERVVVGTPTAVRAFVKGEIKQYMLKSPGVLL